MNLNPSSRHSTLRKTPHGLADDLRTQIDTLQTRLREAELHLEHLTASLELPEHPDHPHIPAALNDTQLHPWWYTSNPLGCRRSSTRGWARGDSPSL